MAVADNTRTWDTPSSSSIHVHDNGDPNQQAGRGGGGSRGGGGDSNVLKRGAEDGAARGRGNSIHEKADLEVGRAGTALKMEEGGVNGAAAGAGADGGPPRSKQSCLACRRLKTRCDGAEDPPCKRCRAGGHECIFVESKRGKRPIKKAPDGTLSDKLRTVEKTLSLVLQSVNAGGVPDPAALQQLQTSLAEGIAADKSKSSAARVTKPQSPESNSDPDLAVSDPRPPTAKRARRDTAASGSSSIAFPSDPNPNEIIHSPFLPNTSLSPHIGNNPLFDLTPRSQDSLPLRRPSPTTSGSLSILADASLAAQMDGRTSLTGLDPTFTLSRVTEALQAEGDEEGEQTKTPAVLSKGIVTPEMAVSMFRIFFDNLYLHLPLLDPETDTTASVCQRSPFLFTAICAVASRFNADPTLHTKCYDEAHACFIDMIATGERSLESVQACMVLTVWTSAPKKAEDRPQRAWQYFGSAVRMGLELGLFRPPAFVDVHLSVTTGKANPWASLKDVPEEVQKDALNRERTWLMAFVIDRNMSAVMGRPYQIHEPTARLIPLHPLSLPFDLGVIAHVELQVIMGQVMDTFRDRIYGLSSAADEMPSPVVIKLFDSRLNEWRQRWCPVPGEPIANNLLFYFHSSKLYLHSIPLHTMLRKGEAVDDPECVSITISAAKSILDLGHQFAEMNVLVHSPDVIFLIMLYSGVFLTKVKASNTQFSQLVDSTELQTILLQTVQDCQAATSSPRHAASTCATMTRALVASWRALSHSSHPSQSASQHAHSHLDSINLPLHGIHPPMSEPASSTSMFASAILPPHTTGLTLDGTLANLPPSPGTYPFLSTPFSMASRPGGYFPSMSGTHTPSGLGHNSFGLGSTDPLDSFLNDTQFFNNVLVGQGADGFFAWPEGLDSAGGLDLNFDLYTTVSGDESSGIPVSAPSEAFSVSM